MSHDLKLINFIRAKVNALTKMINKKHETRMMTFVEITLPDGTVGIAGIGNADMDFILQVSIAAVGAAHETSEMYDLDFEEFLKNAMEKK